MLKPHHATAKLITEAQAQGYAIGAFNVYNLEGALAVVRAAEAERSPVMLQVHPSALHHGGPSLTALCLTAAREATVPMAVHLDHSTSPAEIRSALAAGFSSVMADGSHLTYAENIAFTREMAALAHAAGASVEAELGRLTGTEDDLTVPEYESKLTNPAQAAEFVAETGVDALAVCIGNVHGPYPGEPRLDFERLAAIRDALARSHDVPLVLHGASGLPDALVQRSIELGVTKFNVNTELRQAYLAAVREAIDAPSTDLVRAMQAAIEAMQQVVVGKLKLLGSRGRA